MPAYDLKALTALIQSTAPEVATDTSTPDLFFFIPDNLKFPFATIVTRDAEYDSKSKLDRPGLYRLNIGLDRKGYEEIIGAPPPRKGNAMAHVDFTTINQFMPNPLYARMFWFSIITPSTEREAELNALLKRAYAMVRARIE